MPLRKMASFDIVEIMTTFLGLSPV